MSILRKELFTYRKKEHTQGVSPLTEQEQIWLAQITDLSSWLYGSSVRRIRSGAIAKAYEFLQITKPVSIDPTVYSFLFLNGVNSDLIHSLREVMSKFVYTKPYLLLETIASKPVVVGKHAFEGFLAVIPNFHDIHAATYGDEIIGNCALLSSHLCFQLRVLGIVDELQSSLKKNNLQVELQHVDGNCKGLFDDERSNHWFCSLLIQDGSIYRDIIIDPSFRKIVTAEEYRASERYASDCMVLPRQLDMPVEKRSLLSHDFSSRVLGSSYDFALTYGISVHSFEGRIIPVLTVLSETMRADYWFSQAGSLISDRNMVSKLPLTHCIEIVKLLTQLQKMKFVEGEVHLVEECFSVRYQV